MMETNTFLKPAFLSDRHIQLSVDTSGYCQARCPLCAWPELKSARRIMANDEFQALLNRFKGYSFEEFALNSINEPFVDKNILDKLAMVIESGLEIRSLFFSSNWLMPGEAKIREFAELIKRAVGSGNISWVSINATVSGVDEESYDKWQAGADLGDVAIPYKKLSFARAQEHVVLLARSLMEALPQPASARLQIKAYGHDFAEDQVRDFWRNALIDGGVEEAFIERHIQILLNHALQSFGRAKSDSENTLKKCTSGWLDRQIVVGPDGHVGLCCVEGAHKVNVGNLLDSSLEEVIAGDAYQSFLRIVTGKAEARASDPCATCEFFV